MLCLLDYKKQLIFPRQPPSLYGNPDTLSETCLLKSTLAGVMVCSGSRTWGRAGGERRWVLAPTRVAASTGCPVPCRASQREQICRRGSSLAKGNTGVKHQMFVLYLGCVWAEQLQNERVRLGSGCQGRAHASLLLLGTSLCTLLPTFLYLDTKMNHQQFGGFFPPFLPKNDLQEAERFSYRGQRMSHLQTSLSLLISA